MIGWRPEAGGSVQTVKGQRSTVDGRAAKGWTGSSPQPPAFSLHGTAHLKPLAILAREEAVGVLVVHEGLALSVERQLPSSAVGDVRELRQGRGEVPFVDVARQDLGILGAERFDEVLVMRRLDTREHPRVAAALLGRRVRAGPLLFVPPAIRLPLAAVAVDPQPAF